MSQPPRPSPPNVSGSDWAEAGPTTDKRRRPAVEVYHVTNVTDDVRDRGGRPTVTDEQARARWVLLIYRVPQEPPGRRTYVWRRLRQLGAVYLQQAAAIVPERPELRTALDALSQRIREFGGEVSLLSTVSPDAAWQGDLLDRFNQARDAE